MGHALLCLAFFLLAQPHHRHLQLHHEQLYLALLDELSQCLQQTVLPELLTAECHALRRQVDNGPVEYLQSEKLLNQRVVFKKSSLEGSCHVVLVDKSALAGEVFIYDCENGQNVPAAGAALKEFVIDSENGEQEFPSEGEVELGVLADELSDEGEDIEHAELEVLVWRVFLPM